MPTMRQLEQALIKADAAGDEAAAREIAAEIKRMRAQSVAGENQPGRIASAAKGALSGAANVLLTPFEWAAKGAKALGVPGAAEVVARSEADIAHTNAALAQYQQAHPNWFTGGQIVGEAVASAPFISAGGAGIVKAGQKLAPVAPKVAQAVQRVGRAVQTGGVGTGRSAAQTAAMTRGQRALQMGERMAGGAIAGGGSAALAGQDLENVGWSAAAGGAIPIINKILRGVGGKVVDIGRMPAVRAGKIVREALGKNIDEARRLFSQLSPDDQRLSANLLVEAGIEPRAYIALAEDVTKLRPDERAAILAKDVAAREARLAGAAGGATMEEIRAAARAGRKAVTEEMAPVREEMYRRAGYANEFVPEKMAEATQLENLAADQSAQARRFTLGAINREDFLGQMDDLGDAFNAAEINQQAFRPRAELVKLEQRGEKAAKTAITARERARDIYDEVDALAAEGIKPLRAADLIAPLRAKLADPTIAVDTLEANTIRGVVRKLEAATDKNGMLNPRALGKIMRSGIGDLVEMWSKKVSSGAAPSSGTIQRGQSLGLEMRDMIKDTLRQGGAGDLVDEFFKRSEEGYAAVNRGELAGEAFRLYKQDPTTGAEFRALVGGERPKVVSKIMGGGPESESFTGAFAADPERLAALQQSARELETLERVRTLAGEGRQKAADILGGETPTMLRNLTRMSLASIPKTRIAAEAGEQAMAANIYPQVKNILAERLMTGPGALRTMETYPTTTNIDALLSRAPASVRNIMAQIESKNLAGSYPEITEEFPAFDPQTGMVLIGIGETADGQRYPMYGKPSANLNSMMRLGQ